MASTPMTSKRLRQIAEEILEIATKNAEEKAVPTHYKAASANLSLNYQRSFAESVDLKNLEHGNCWCAKGAILSYDLRKSSSITVQLKPRKSYIAMHTYIGTITAYLNSTSGMSFGLRGDGALYGYIAKILSDTNDECSDNEMAMSLKKACESGEAIIRTIDQIVVPLLRKKDILPAKMLFQVGVGIDTGLFVVTNMGHGSVSELTVYGECVNRACKNLNQGNQAIYINKDSCNLFPKSKTGKVDLAPVPTKSGTYQVIYPKEYQIIPEE
jgi:class 3 adenylate cyclase